MKKKLWALTLAITLCLSLLAGCKSADAQPSKPDDQNPTQAQPQQEDQILRIAETLAYERPTYDPSITLGSNSINALFHDTLMVQDEAGNMVGSAAESVDISDDGLVYTFHLREGMKWPDDKPITADQFLYTLMRTCTPETAAEGNYLVLPYIKNAQKFYDGTASAEEFGVKAPDENTLVITLENAASYFLQICNYAMFAPTRKDIVEANPDSWSIKPETCLTNGPFKATEIKSGEKICFVKNENYWNADAVKLTEIVIYFFADENTAFSAYQTGEVDICNFMPGGEVLTMYAQNNEELLITPTLNITYLSINNAKLSDVNLRKAIGYAMDREVLIDSSVVKVTQTALLGMVPPGITLAEKEFRAEAGDHGYTNTADLDKAKQALVDAGYPNGEGLQELVILAMNSEAKLKQAQIYQEMLKQVGIKSTVKPVESKVFWATQLEGDYDLSVSGWGGDYVHPMTFLEFKTTNNGQNVEKYSNPAFDEAIRNAQLAINPDEQLAFLVEAESLLVEEYGVIPLIFSNDVCAIKPYVKGIWKALSKQLSISEAYIEGKN